MKVDLILTSDWHLRETVPVCRTDDFWTVQWVKVEYIHTLQRQYGCPVLHAGDLYHHWKPSPYLTSHTIDYIPNDFWTVYGQHDLPQHNLNLRQKSGIHVLHRANRAHVLVGTHWGEEVMRESFSVPHKNGARNILVWHHMVWQGRRPYPGCTDPSSIAVLKKYSDYDLILTGDNHRPFVEEYDGRVLVNPGPITRQSADETHAPRVYLYNAERNTVWPEYIPYTKDAVSRVHLEERIEREGRIDAFISKLQGEWEAGLSFEENLKRFFSANKIREATLEIINQSLEHEG